MKRFFLLCLLVVATAAVYAQNRGICGKVLWLEGNQMPGSKASPGKGVEREILIYEATTMQQATSHNGFYTDIKTRLVATVNSHADGAYKIKLPPGKYSVFTREPEGLFANLFDQDAIINPVVVKARGYTVLDLILNYRAAY
jgi:hypothetical protein